MGMVVVGFAMAEGNTPRPTRLAFSRPRAQEGQGECLGGSTEKEAGVDKTECALQNSHWDQIADIAS